jgi:hypothetical protein
MAARTHAQTIDKLTAADSVLSLLNALRSERLPPAERMAIARAQIEAVEEWLAAFLDVKSTRSARPAV